MRKIILLIIAISFSGFLLAQHAATFNFSLNHMALSVKTVDRSAEFYKNVLKLQEITNRSKLEGVRWFALEAVRGLTFTTELLELSSPLVILLRCGWTFSNCRDIARP